MNWYKSLSDGEENEKLKRCAKSILNQTDGEYTRQVVDVNIYYDKNIGKYVVSECKFYDLSGRTINYGESILIGFGEYGVIDMDPQRRNYDTDRLITYDIYAKDSVINKQWIATMAFEMSSTSSNKGKTYLECVKDNYNEIIRRNAEDAKKKIEEKAAEQRTGVEECINSVVDLIMQVEGMNE